MKKDQNWVNEQIKSLRKSSLETEKFCHEKLGMPILTEEEKKIQRKKLYEEIVKQSEGQPPIDHKKLYEEVKNIIKMLEYDITR